MSLPKPVLPNLEHPRDSDFWLGRDNCGFLSAKCVDLVRVRFVLMQESLDGNFIGGGVTDADGVCEIKLPGKSESSITVGRHKVMLLETGGSDEAREAYANGDPSAVKKEQKNRKNRPLPKIYERLSSTPLRYDISPDETRIDIVLE